MNNSKKTTWWDTLIDYTPIISLLLGIITIALKAANIENNRIWLIGLTVLPSILIIIYSTIILYKNNLPKND